ncbi:GNAT family N-acetyltransferase [Crassaminicella profunda]|uniref:GNAT family N-acetyltransferase n=1 Tax=Crassaminicella profunda TaxID=1286698 RepID=UPI001CA76CDD|nr:GNAT family N-acetyltransferase [Crassaminicella profunda]QZY54467.1 GNAT family N-acetyltransferase [Crassaminicella profunda]
MYNLYGYLCNYPIYILEDIEMAIKAAQFFTRKDSFGTYLTRGELENAHIHPVESLGDEKSRYWYVLDGDEMIACAGVKEAEHKNGIFLGTFNSIKKEYRGNGIGEKLLQITIEFVKNSEGRGLLIDTSDKESYCTIRCLLKKIGFQQVGRFPDYYEAGEDALWYYLNI